MFFYRNVDIYILIKNSRQKVIQKQAHYSLHPLLEPGRVERQVHARKIYRVVFE